MVGRTNRYRSTSNCVSCAASIDQAARRCRYCGAHRSISVTNALDAAIQAADRRLVGAKDGGCLIAGIGLCAVPVAAVAVAFAGDRWYVNVGLAAAVLVGGSVAAALLASYLERRLIERCYDRQARRDIIAFCKERGLRRTDFDERADEVLDKDAPLRRFLFRADGR